ncbi:hypothetical protein [Actinomadura violacea]|uniref:Uncharacterized protein n=1 Tax=Actinomadura violacea TaxID=2819934 RepID=A0ABS3RPX7_9ACTN|nr:hypothetical protein [Actinomadura violacea]MBO2458125.1 hypothetical protein [Actinomadura violacea]
MNGFTQDVSYREVVDTLAPTAVSQYLATQHWELESRRDHIREIWRLFDDHGRLQGRIMLPLATDFEDFRQRFYDALRAIGKINDWDAQQLQEQISAVRADLFFIRLDQDMTDGTIPLLQAEASLSAIKKMLRSAATSAANPNHSHRGRRPSTVTDYLDEDVRLGHTKRGSFVFTVVSRFGDRNAMPSDAQPESPIEKAFGRQVMETLAKGLETTQELTRGRRNAALNFPEEWGLSAELIESLEELTRPDTLHSLDLSFEWAAAEEKPEVGTRPIKLQHSAVDTLADVREQLIRREGTRQRETLVGIVKSLSRENDDTEEGEHASVTILADVKGKLRNVHVDLSGENHEWAILAYRRKLPLTITGDLVYERRSWRLIGKIRLDTSLLARYRES